jgi:PAS domain S-box-containing protein
MNDSDKTKEQLIQEIELLRALIDALPDRLYVKDAKSRFVICNKAVEKDSDVNLPDDLTGKSDFDLFPPELAKELYAAEQEIIRTGKPIINEEMHRARHKDGKANWSLCTKLPWRDKNGNIIGIIGSNRDITERKIAEEALYESETRYKAIFESAKEGILIADVETKQLVYANPALCRMYGYTEEELCRKTVCDIHPKSYAQEIEDSFAMHQQHKGGKLLLNVSCLKKDGTVFFADIKIVTVIAEQKMRHLVFFTDTTERKHTEDALRESEARYKAIFESAREGILVANIETKQFKYANPAICKMFGYTAEELTHLTINDIHPKKDLPQMLALFAIHVRGEKILSRNIPYLHKDGTTFYADIRTTNVEIDKTNCTVGLITDTTERKHTEDALRESETRYKAIFESAKEGILVAETQTKRFKYANPAICEMFGYTAEELTRMSIDDIHPREFLTEAERDFENKVHGQKEIVRNMPCLRKDGKIFYADINAVNVLIDNVQCLVGFFIDATKRKRTEDALRESEARYKAIFDYATEGIVVTDVETKQHKYANPAFCRMFGYTAEELQQMTVYDIHPKEYMPSVIAGLEAQARGEKTLVPNVPCLHKNRTVFYANIDATCVVIDQIPCNVGLFTNITERKNAEEALRESEQKYRSLIEQLPAITYIIPPDEAGSLLYVSPQSQKILGFSSEEFKADPKLWQKMIHPDDYGHVMAEFARSYETGEPCNWECRLFTKDGRIVWGRNNARMIRDAQGKPLYWQGVMYDITTSKLAEEALRQSEEKFRGLAERSSDMIFVTDTKGTITYLSPASEKIYGYKPHEMVGKNFTNFLVKSEISKAVGKFRERLQGKKHGILYLEAKKKNGSGVSIELSSSLIMQDGKIAGTQGIIKDVTERKKAEEQLKKAHEELEIRVKKRTADLARAVETLQKEVAERKHAEESLRSAEVRFRTIFENTIVGLYRTTPGGQILLANPALVKMMGCRSFKELARFNVEKNGFDSSTPRSIFKERIKKEGRVIGLESAWHRLDGTKLFVSESAFAVKDAKGKILYYEGTAHDITKRKEAEEKLMLYQQQLRSLASELSLAEERLRRRIAAELHDHIAQNLAISKIKLESLAGDTESGQTKSLKEVIDLISQTIDASRSLTFEISPPVLYELGFEAAVGWLARQTRQRFGLDVEFINDEKPKPLNTDIRVLLFQAVRELLVNVVKHAKAKKAKVYVRAVDDNIQVTVEDDGVGFDITALNPAKDFTKGGFGLFNIRERLDQIGGSVIIQSGRKKGTQIIMTAPMEKLKKPRIRFSDTRSGKNGRRRKIKK